MDFADQSKSNAFLRVCCTRPVSFSDMFSAVKSLIASSIIAPISFRLVHLYTLDRSIDSPQWDPTFQETNIAIATAVLMNTNLVLTCVPFLKPLMEALQPGWSTSDLVKGIGYNATPRRNIIMSGDFPTGSVI